MLVLEDNLSISPRIVQEVYLTLTRLDAIASRETLTLTLTRTRTRTLTRTLTLTLTRTRT